MKKFIKRTPTMALAAFAALLAGQSASAQITVTYTNGEDNYTHYDTTAPNDPLTLTIATGVATQSGHIFGFGGVIKTGAGTLILGFNAYLGPTNINAGTLSISDTDAIGLSSDINISGGTLRSTGVSVDFNTKTINIGTGGATIEVTGTNELLTSGITGGQDDALTKTGTGTLILDNPARYNGVTNINAGTLSFSDSGQIGWSIDSLNIAGGTLRFTGRSGNPTNEELLNRIDIGTGGAAIEVTGTNELTLSGPITGGPHDAFTKTGTGTLIMDSVSYYTGETNVSGGVLLFNGYHDSGTVMVESGAKLGGTGSFYGAVDVHGTLSPGASRNTNSTSLVESLQSGALTLHNGSTFEYQLDSSVANSVGADLQVVYEVVNGQASGDLTLSGTVALTIDDLAAVDAAYASGTTFSLLHYSGIWNGGLFTYGGNELSNGEEFTAGLNTWQITYDATVGGLNFTNEYITLNNPSARFVNITNAPDGNGGPIIPEPTSALLLLGSGGLLLLRRRRAAG